MEIHKEIYEVDTIGQLDILYSILDEKYPNNEIDVIYNYNKKKYQVKVTDKELKQKREQNVPVDVDIEVIYGDSVSNDTKIYVYDPLQPLSNNFIKIEDLVPESNWKNYSEFKILEKQILHEKQYALTHYYCLSIKKNGDVYGNKIKKIIRHKTNKHLYRITTKGYGHIDVTTDHSLLLRDDRGFHKKIKPQKLRLGDKLLCTLPIIHNKSNESMENSLKRNNCMHHSISRLDTSDNTKVIDIRDLGKTHEFVYDLETDIGNFITNNICVSNTDSVFVKFKYNREYKRINREDTVKLGILCGENLTNEIFNIKPIEMEYEKIMGLMILLAKKRYMANKYENPKDPFEYSKVDAKGIATMRRDYCQLTKKCYNEIIKEVLKVKELTNYTITDLYDIYVKETKNTDKEYTINKVISIYKSYLDKLDNYDIDFNDIILSNELAGNYKNPEREKHVRVAEKMKERNLEVNIGDRIPYVYVENYRIYRLMKNGVKRTETKAFDLTEDPNYVKENNLKIDRLSYLNNLCKPILAFLFVITSQIIQEDSTLFEQVLSYTNDYILKYGGKVLKEKDFKIDEVL